ncbi:Shikimate dehydrogenase [Phycisphaerae bacterium RAS1]|nr:Shikimate dehydrogenase [Phycisphaerae bacterium RAS1]
MPITRLIVPLVHADPPLETQAAAALAAGADLVELRVDCIGDADAVERLLRRTPGGRFVLTIRSSPEGGLWDGDDAERVALFERLGLLRPGLVDVELATWLRSSNLRQKIELVAGAGGSSRDAAPAAGELNRPRDLLILSHHDFRQTPADLDALFDRLRAERSDVIKAALRCGDARDACRILLALRRTAAWRPTIALGMGEAGLLTRVLGPKFGAFGVFAALDAGGESAPGQPTIDELRRLRWGAIGPRTRVYGVIGWPVGHSRSPALHNAAMAADGIDGVYVPLPVQPSEAAFTAFMDLAASHPELDFTGFSVTIPHKEHALRWLRARGAPLGEWAVRCGAANTLALKGGRWTGDNTDAPAVLDVLDVAAVLAGPQTRALVLGAGGVARAVVAALASRGARLTISNRTAERASALAAEFGADVLAWDGRAAASADLIVNCTSVGMQPGVAESPLPAGSIRAAQTVFDTVYAPRETRLLREAAATGAKIIRGDALFLAQARRQYEIWHERTASFGGA